MDRKQCPQCNAWYSSSRGLKIDMGYCSKIDVSKLKSADNNSHSFQFNQHPLLSINTDLCNAHSEISICVASKKYIATESDSTIILERVVWLP